MYTLFIRTLVVMCLIVRYTIIKAFGCAGMSLAYQLIEPINLCVLTDVGISIQILALFIVFDKIINHY